MRAAPRLALVGLPALCLLGLSDAPGPAPRHDAWRIVGPGGGGTMRRPAVSPHDPLVVVEGCDMTGAYITRDGGLSWRMFSLGAPPAAFAFDPKDMDVIYATTAALWRSRDAGRTWTMVYPDPEKNTVVHARTDHGDFVITTDDPAYAGSGRDVDVHAVGIDPSDTRFLAIAVSSADSPRPGSPSAATRLLVSRDGGRTWTRAGDLAGTERVFAFRFEGPTGERHVEAVGETGVYVGGKGALQRLDAPPPGRITSASFGQDGPRGLLYVTTAIEAGASGPVGGLFVSEDGGRTWRGANGGLLTGSSGFGAGEVWGDAKDSRPGLGPVAASARHGLVAYAGLRGLKRSANGPKFNGIAKTVDGGATWAIVHEEADRRSSNLEGSWIEVRAPSDGYSIWFDAPYDLAVAPTDPDVCFATDLFRTYRTRDGGRTWAQVNSAKKGEGRWASRGLDVTNTYGIHWDPFDPKRVFLSNTDTGLFRSEDGTLSWTSSVEGVPLRWRNTTYWVDFDPEVPGLMWGAFSSAHDLPRPKMWRGRDPDTYQGGVGVSTDGGKTWSRAGTGAPEMATTHVLVDRGSPKGKRTLYATGFGRGVYKSVDGGATWAQKNAGLEQPQPFAWRITRAADGTLYLIVARRSERGEIGDERDGALYRSTDGAEHWVRLTLPAGTNGPNGLAVDPKDPLRLYLAAWGRATPGGDTGGGIFVSADGGREWKAVLPAFQHVYDVTIDPRDPAVLYASGFDQSALRSADRGATWARIRGFNFKWGQRVVPDPRDPSKIYVTTYGGGVWHGPAKGDPDAAEDVVPSDRFRSGGHDISSSPAPELAKGEARLEALVEANVAGIHAFQLELARKAGKGDPACWPRSAPSDAALAALVDHQTALLKNDPSVVKAWAEGRPSAFDLGKDLKPLLDSGLSLSGATLPINVFSTYLASAAPGRPRVQVRAIANLYQTVLEVERDGDRLQELFAFYIGLGLPVYVGQLGLPGTDADLLAVGRQLEGKSCASPVGLTAAEWQIAGRKVWNWGEKNQHIRDARVLAKELLAEPEVTALVPKMRAMRAQKVAVLGHSFTMDLHWSSPSAFVPIVAAMFAVENAKVEFRLFQAGGLTSSRAYKNFYADAVAWKPDVVLLVVLNRTDEDLANFRKLGEGLKAAGARVLVFDDVHDPDAADPVKLRKEAAVAKEAGITVVEVGRVLAASPDRSRFLCLDHIHMTEPYHRLMAKEWLKVLVTRSEQSGLGD